MNARTWGGAVVALAVGLVLAACGGGGSAPASPPPAPQAPVAVTVTYPKTAGPDTNPRKGWNSSWWTNLPNTSVGFQYIPWAVLEPQNGVYDWAKVEEILDRPGTRGKHVVLRLYCDWFRESTTSCPAWLFDQVGVRRIKGVQSDTLAGEAWLTDYNDARFVAEVTAAIQALASRYNADPRMHALQVGVLGYWGEWHNAGFSYANGSGYTISDTTARAVLDAYKTRLTDTPLQARYPWREPLKSAGGLGFHNDFFVPNNAHSDEFDTALAASGAWLNGPIGGEVPPREAADLPRELNALYLTDKGESMIRTGRYSTMAPGAYAQGPTDVYYGGYMRLHRLMGYTFQIDSARFAQSLARTDRLAVQVNGSNVGIAPTYHAWTTQIALLDANNQPVRTETLAHDFRAVRPQATFTLNATLDPSGLAAGDYRLALRVIQPGAERSKTSAWKLDARNTYILFANDLPTLAGTWGSDNALQGGWSVLGRVTVR
jgi:hypothetical protein